MIRAKTERKKRNSTQLKENRLTQSKNSEHTKHTDNKTITDIDKLTNGNKQRRNNRKLNIDFMVKDIFVVNGEWNTTNCAISGIFIRYSRISHGVLGLSTGFSFISIQTHLQTTNELSCGFCCRLMSPYLFLFFSVYISMFFFCHILFLFLSVDEWVFCVCVCVYETLVGLWIIFIIVHSHFSKRLNRFCHVQSFVPNSLFCECICALVSIAMPFIAAHSKLYFFFHFVFVFHCACLCIA